MVKSVPKFNLHDKFLSLVCVSPSDYKGLPSCIVPGGETSPALAFKLFSKGSLQPSLFHSGQFDESDFSHFPKSESELNIVANDFLHSVSQNPNTQVEEPSVLQNPNTQVVEPSSEVV